MSSGRIPLEKVLTTCENAGTAREPVTASEVADELGCTRRTALNKLDELAECGDLLSKKVGARSRVWWRPDDPSRTADSRSRNRTDDSVEPVPSGKETSLSAPTEREYLEDERDEIFGRISDGFYALDDQWRFTYVSERAEELIDYQRADLIGENIWEVFDEVGKITLGEEYRTAMETQEQTSFEVYDETLDTWFEVHAYPSETGLSVYFRDVTERKQRDRELEQSERRYRTLVEHFPNGAVALVDENLHYRTVGGIPIVASKTAEDLESQPVGEVLPPELADELVPRYEAAFEGEQSAFEAEMDDRIYQIHVVPVRDDDGDIFATLGMSQDITDRKENQRKLAESESRYRTLVEHFPNGSVGLFDEDLHYTAVGGQLLDKTGLSPEERIGRSISDIHPDDLLAEVEPYFQVALEGEANSFKIEYDDLHLSAHTLPVRNADDEVYAGMLVVQDVTERQEAQRELEERNDRLDSFASMLAHELRNPVTIGQIYSQQLPAETDSEAISYISEAFDRIEDMIDVLLVLTRGREAIGERTPVQVADVARDAWDKIEALDSTLEVESCRTIQADETYVQHLFRNLFDNAVEHGGADVTITVGELPTGFYVADDGSGIPAEERDVVFEAGYTTASQKGGTGLGLAFVEKLTEVYDWECSVTESTTGGARFEFTVANSDSHRD